MKLIIWIYQLIRGFVLKMKHDCVSAYSAQAAFFVIISFFPFVMFLITLFQFLPVGEENIVSFVQTFLPSVFSEYVANIIHEIFTTKGSTAIISVTAVTALWSGSKGFLAIIRGMNSIYGIPERRNYFQLRLICALYSLMLAVMISVIFLLLMFGNQLFRVLMELLPWLRNYVFPSVMIRILVSFGIMLLFFLLLYIVIPSRKIRIRQAFFGSLFSSAGWFVFTFLYSYYMDNFYSSTIYGSLTTIVLLMLWLYFCMYIVFIGAELNVWLEALSGNRTGNSFPKSMLTDQHTPFS